MGVPPLLLVAVTVALAGCSVFDRGWGEADRNCPWPEATELSWVGHANPVDVGLRGRDPARDGLVKEFGYIYVSAMPIPPPPDVIAPVAERKYCWVVAEGGGVAVEIDAVPDGWEPP